jgi:hypothetical protein
VAARTRPRAHEADGSTWRTLGTAPGTPLHVKAAGDGGPARCVRLVTVGATADPPLTVGELRALGNN